MDKLVKAEKEARELGISYGVYIGYKTTGFLPRFRKIVANRKADAEEMKNVYCSNIIGSNRSVGSIEHKHSK